MIHCGTWLVLTVALSMGFSASVRSFPNYDYGGKSHEQFLTDAIERSSPGNARLLAELFGGLDLGISFGDSDAQAVISVGGAATRCQHQSPCYDTKCKLCYDPLLRIHGRCGGASYFTCRGTLPKACLPYSCTARTARSNLDPLNSQEKTAVFVKKFPRYQDPFCLGKVEKARSLSGDDFRKLNATIASGNHLPHPRDSDEDGPDPSWVMPVPDAITPCQGFDICLDLRCGSTYDPYLGAHVSGGKMTYYDCEVSLPDECRPLRCTDTNVKELFYPELIGKADIPKMASDPNDSPLMVRNFPPLNDGQRNCV